MLGTRRAYNASVVDFRAKLSQILLARGPARFERPARERSSAVAGLTAAVLVGSLSACGGGGEETPYRERPAYRAFQAHCQQSRQSCGPEGLCEPTCADIDVEQGGCQVSCEPHRCLSNDWTHGACIKCCADQAHSTPDALSRCQKKCAELYEL